MEVHREDKTSTGSLHQPPLLILSKELEGVRQTNRCRPTFNQCGFHRPMSTNLQSVPTSPTDVDQPSISADFTDRCRSPLNQCRLHRPMSTDLSISADFTDKCRPTFNQCRLHRPMSTDLSTSADFTDRCRPTFPSVPTSPTDVDRRAISADFTDRCRPTCDQCRLARGVSRCQKVCPRNLCLPAALSVVLPSSLPPSSEA